jgi:hypothetical protein
MTDFLGSLVARTTGLGEELIPRPRVRFESSPDVAPAPADQPDEDVTTVEDARPTPAPGTAEVVGERPSPSPPAARQQSDRGDDGGLSPTPAPRPARAPTPAVSDRAVTPAEGEPAGPRPSPGRAHQPAEEPAAPAHGGRPAPQDPPSESRTPSVPTRSAARRPGAAVRTAPRVSVPDVPRATEPVQARPAGGAPGAMPPAPIGTPERTISPPPPPPPGWLRPPPLADTPAARAADDHGPSSGEPVVEVTIGRVEVRSAPSREPAAARPPRRRPGVLPLDEYLARRSGAR